MSRTGSAAEVTTLACVELAVGDWVVYAGHGTGRVAARERRTVLGVEQEVVVLELADGLTVTLPLGRAHERLRAVVGDAELHDVQRTLREGAEINPDKWSKRLRLGQEKLIGGDLLELVEIVRDGALRERTPTLTHSEKERRLYAKARRLLAQEISCACRFDEDAADAWIEEQLGATDS
jgi:RNA polymerase-interacting CarD/CdnL/TRCF family regulator